MKKLIVLGILCVLVFAVTGAAFAEESYHKYRISFSINNQAFADAVRTNSDNTALYKRKANGQVVGVDAIDDPRKDSGVENELSIDDALRYDLGVSYGYLKWRWGELTLDASVGYAKSDVGDVEVAAEFSSGSGGGVDPPHLAPPCGQLTRYHMFYVPVGEFEQIPVKLGTTMRFRPRAQGGPLRAISPYVSVGIGYIYTDLKGSDEFLTLSNNLANSTGSYLTATGHGSASTGRVHRFEPAKADAPDSFEYHMSAGLDFPLGKGWTVYFNAGYMWADEVIDVTADGRHDFGTATPNGEVDKKYPETGTPVVFQTGGLFDFGSGTPTQIEGQPCHFAVGPQDGLVDVGKYYFQGGTIRYDGPTVGLGVRYTF